MSKSNSIFRWFSFSLLLLSVALTACAPQASGPVNPVSQEGAIGGYAELVDALRENGAEVEPAGQIEQVFFDVPGQVVKLNGADVQVFEFADEASRQAVASTISPNGSSIGTNMVTWIDQPHFWSKGKLIVLYIGSDAGVIESLNSVLGNPIVG